MSTELPRSGVPEMRDVLRSPRDVSPALDVLRATGTRLEGLEEEVMRGAVQRGADTMLGNPAAVEARVEANGRTRLNALNGVIAANRDRVNGPNGFRTPLLREVSETHRQRLEGIMTGVSGPAISYGDPPDPEARRYVSYTSRNVPGQEERYHGYRLNVPHLKADQAYVESLLNDASQKPEAKAELVKLLAMLRDFEKWDPEVVIGYSLRAGRPAGSLDQGVAHLGKLAAVIILAAMALITGIMAAANRKFSATPLFYLGLALLVANPDMIKKTFGPKEQRELMESAEALKDKGFNNVCRDNNIIGNDWAAVAARTMEDKAVTRKAVSDIENGRTTGEGVTEYINGMPQKMRPALRAMMEKTVMDENNRPTGNREFVVFARALMRVDGEEPRRLVVEYIRAGMWNGANVPGVRLPAGPPIAPVAPAAPRAVAPLPTGLAD